MTTAQRKASSSEERWRLEDERDFLQRSLDDADAEHDVGDLSDADHQALRQRDERRLAAVEAKLTALVATLVTDRETDRETDRVTDRETDRETETQLETELDRDLDHGGASDSPRSVTANPRERASGEPSTNLTRWKALRRRLGKRRKLWAIGGVVAILAGIGLLVGLLSSPRLPGESSSGSVQLSKAQEIQRELAQAADYVNQGHLTDALTLYQVVLVQDPNQPEALSENGWLEYEAGVETKKQNLLTDGQASIERAEQVEPTGYAPHLYLGTIDLQQDHDPTAAAAEYRKFLAEHPPKQLIDQSSTFLREAFNEAGQPVPSSVPR